MAAAAQAILRPVRNKGLMKNVFAERPSKTVISVAAAFTLVALIYAISFHRPVQVYVCVGIGAYVTYIMLMGRRKMR